MVANNNFAKFKLRAFIPSYKVLRTGIIRDVDQSLSLECIKNNIKSSVKVLDIQRLNRRITTDGQTSYLPSRTICTKFAGQFLPNEVALFNTLYSVDPYVPKARICYVCYRAGHIGKDCKSTKPRCLYCGGDHDRSFECEGKRQPKKCINCGGDHLATSFDCLVIKQYKEAIKLAAYDNIPNIEARKIVMANRQGNTSNLSTNPRNFPYLSGSQRHSLDDFASYNRFSPLESADYNSPTFSSNSYAAMAASTSLPSPNASRRSHDSSKKNKSVSFRHNPFLRTDSFSESFERLLPPMDGQFSATPPAHSTLAFTHGNNGRMREDFSSSSSDVYPLSEIKLKLGCGCRKGLGSRLQFRF
ncbi:hypothetical protein ALC62_03855 [Cyphomyrmex costatus]|uniref:CCHC-type domain-containing protein n=1 Tax=Cyphomyrmex costatus TaxID=456900 RepID=A0A151IL89_9HYME|nr:hypothetical protein ALC62_03855 [Cyphomyrmex costatus]